MKHLKCKLKFKGHHGKFHGHHGKLHRHHGKFHAHHGNHKKWDGHRDFDHRHWWREQILKVLLKAGNNMDEPYKRFGARHWDNGRRLSSSDESSDEEIEPSRGWKRCRKGVTEEYEGRFLRGWQRNRCGAKHQWGNSETNIARHINGRRHLERSDAENPVRSLAKCGRWKHADRNNLHDRNGCFRGRRPGNSGPEPEKEEEEETVVVRGVILSRGHRAKSV